jgi:hypothetical protein
MKKELMATFWSKLTGKKEVTDSHLNTETANPTAAEAKSNQLLESQLALQAEDLVLNEIEHSLDETLPAKPVNLDETIPPSFDEFQDEFMFLSEGALNTIYEIILEQVKKHTDEFGEDYLSLIFQDMTEKGIEINDQDENFGLSLLKYLPSINNAVVAKVRIMINPKLEKRGYVEDCLNLAMLKYYRLWLASQAD